MLLCLATIIIMSSHHMLLCLATIIIMSSHHMLLCYYISIIGECNNKDCQFMHIDADTLKVKDCPWYDRGFCKHG